MNCQLLAKRQRNNNNRYLTIYYIIMHVSPDLCYCVEERTTQSRLVSRYRTLDPFSALADFLLKAMRLHSQYAPDFLFSGDNTITIIDSKSCLDPKLWISMRAKFTDSECFHGYHSVRIFTETSKGHKSGFDATSADFYKSMRYIGMMSRAATILQEDTHGQADIAQIMVVFAARNKYHPLWARMREKKSAEFA